jgi:hypothetical protein
MSELTQTIVVQPNDINITVDTNNITFTPSGINMNIYAGGVAAAGGNNTQLQYNDFGSFGGIPNVTWNGSSLSLGNVANVKMTGGTNGYVLITDGTGNLSWSATSGGGNGTPGGTNTQVQFNNNGLFGGDTGFTYDYNTNILSVETISPTYIAGNVSVQEIKEKVTTSASPATGTINFDYLSQAILFNTANATANFTLNIRGNSTTTLDSVLSSNQSATLRFINTNGLSAYYANVIQIDGAVVSPLWVYGSGAPASGTVSGKDTYDLNIIKTASNTYTIFGIKTGYQ